MSESTGSSGGGIGFIGLLTVVFITLKLASLIDWSWWWVLSPVLAVIALIGFVVMVMGIDECMES